MKQKKIERQKSAEKVKLIAALRKFCRIDLRNKVIYITHYGYDALTKVNREKIADLKLYGFYIQWEIFDIPEE